MGGQQQRRIRAAAVTVALLGTVIVLPMTAATGPAAAGTASGAGKLTLSPQPSAWVAGSQPATTTVDVAVSVGEDGDVAFLAGTVATNRRTRIVLDAGGDEVLAPGTYTDHTGSDSIAGFFGGGTKCATIDESSLKIASAVYTGDTLTGLTGSYFVRCGTARTVGTFAFPANASQPWLQADDRDIDLHTSGFINGKTVTVTLRNPSAAGIDITSAAMNGGAGFSVEDDLCSGTTIAPAGTCTLKVRYQQSDMTKRTSLLQVASASYPTPFVLFAEGTAGYNAYGEFVPLARTALFNSSTGLGRVGATPGALTGGVTEHLAVAGHAGVPATGAVAVVLHATVSGATTDGSLLAVKGGATMPAANSMSYPAGRTTNRMVIAAVAADGTVDLRASSNAQVALDVLGWIASDNVAVSGYRWWPNSQNGLVASTIRGARTKKGPVTTTAKVMNLTGVATNEAQPTFVTITVTQITADADLRVWKVGDSEPAAVTMHVLKGTDESMTMIVPAGVGGAVNVRMSAGKASVAFGSAIDLMSEARFTAERGSNEVPKWVARLVVASAPIRMFDTGAGQGPLASKATRYEDASTASTLFKTAASSLLGVLTTTQSGADGAVTQTLGGNDVIDVVARVGHDASNLGGARRLPGAAFAIPFTNKTKKPTDYRYDAVAAVSDSSAGPTPIVAATATVEPTDPSTPLVTRVPTDGVGPLPETSPSLPAAVVGVLPPEQTTVVTELGAAAWSTTADVALTLLSTDLGAPTTEHTGTAAVMSDGSIRFADDTVSISIATGTDGVLATGTYVTPPSGATYDGISAIGLADVCPGGVSDAVTEIDEVTYSGLTLTKLVGRFSAACVDTGGLTGDLVTHGTFAFPADETQPILQVGQRRYHLAATPFSQDTVEQTIVVSNTGSAVLDLGTLKLVSQPDFHGDLGIGMTKPTDGCSGVSLDPDETCSVVVRYHTSSLTPRGDIYRLEIPSNATSSQRPYWLSVTGGSSWNAYGDFVPLDTRPYFDTRTGLGRTGTPTTPLAANVTEVFTAAGHDGVPSGAETIGAVVMLTVRNPSAAGSITVFDPTAGASTGVSLAFAKGLTLSQQVIVPISIAGTSAIRSTAATHVSMDVIGFIGSDAFSEIGHGALRLDPWGPERLADTKAGFNVAKGPVKAGGTITVDTGETKGRMLVLVITVVAPTANTEVRVWNGATDEGGDDGPAAPAGLISFPKGVTRSVTVFVRPGGGGGAISLTSSAGSTNFTVDLAGRFDTPALKGQYLGRLMVMSAPERVLDTRDPGGKGPKLGAKRFEGWSTRALSDSLGIKTFGILGTVTTLSSSSSARLEFFATNNSVLPTGVTISARAGQDVSNMAVFSTLGEEFIVYNAAGSTHYTLDISAMILLEPLPG